MVEISKPLVDQIKEVYVVALPFPILPGVCEGSHVTTPLVTWYLPSAILTVALHHVVAALRPIRVVETHFAAILRPTPMRLIPLFELAFGNRRPAKRMIENRVDRANLLRRQVDCPPDLLRRRPCEATDQDVLFAVALNSARYPGFG